MCFVCMCARAQVSGLSVWIGRQLEPMSGLPPWAVTLLACLLVSAVTEFASNPATLTVFLPILSALVRHTLSLTRPLKTWPRSVDREKYQIKGEGE